MDVLKSGGAKLKAVCLKTKSFFCQMDRNKKGGAVLAVAVVLIGAGFFIYYRAQKGQSASIQEVRERIEKIAEDSGQNVEVGEIKIENGLYKVAVDINSSPQELYVTKDGKNLIQGMISFDEIDKQNQAQKEKETPKEIPKSDKPKVELFVMSYCPFGIQMEKGLAPVIATLGKSIDFQLRFVDYAMHGDKEINENLIQHCVQKNNPEKLNRYLDCFNRKGEGKSDTCLATVGIVGSKIKACVAETDKQFSIAQKAADKNNWSGGKFPPFDLDKDQNDAYKIEGSPTLVLNGVITTSKRDPASLLKTICQSFNSQPKECEAKLSTETPSSSFGEGTAKASNDASCGN